MGQGSWERSIACWKCREIINNNLLMEFAGVVEILRGDYRYSIPGGF